MDLPENLEERISALKKKLADETYGFKKALSVNGGYPEAKRLLLESMATSKELENAIKAYRETLSG